MNIFVVDSDPVIAAQSLCDSHVVKMTLETAQILCTTLAGLGVATPYKPTHKRHPCTVLASQTRGNFAWLLEHGFALSAEYTHRYGKTHGCHRVLTSVAPSLSLIPAGQLQPFVLAMPAEFHRESAVDSYRAYYRAKQIRKRWTQRVEPDWHAQPIESD